MVDAFERLGTMRYHGDNPAAPTHVQDRLGQCLLALRIEIRRWLIEYNQERLAVEGARKSDALSLARRKRHSAFADFVP